jgi:hypothetical protein
VLGIAQLREIFEHAEKRLLRHFFGIFALPAQQPAIVKNPGPKMVHEFFESAGVAS